MEGGSRLRLLLRIIHNCLESKVLKERKFAFIDSADLCAVLVDAVAYFSQRKDINETWHLSCYLDLLEILVLLASICNTEMLQILAKIFCLADHCLAYPFDKQHRIKVLFLSIESNLLNCVLNENKQDRTMVYSVLQNLTPDVINQMFVRLKPLMKIPALVLSIYKIILQIMQIDILFHKHLLERMTDESFRWFLDNLIKDFNQNKYLELVTSLLSLLTESNVLAEIVLESCPQVLNCIVSPKFENVRISLLKLCIQVLGCKNGIEW